LTDRRTVIIPDSLHPAWRALDFFAGAVVHGLLLAFLAPWLGVPAWLGATLAAATACAQGDRLRALLGARAARLLLALYAAIVGAAAAAVWLRVAAYDPWLAGLILLYGLWTAALLRFDLDPLLGVWVAPALTAAALLVVQARFAPLAPVVALLAAGLAMVLASLYAGRLRSVGRWFFALSVVTAAAAGANDIFAHGADFTGERWLQTAGIHPVLTWTGRPHRFKNVLGLDLRFARVDAFDRLLVGSDKGLFLFDVGEMRQLPVGPAPTSLTLDLANKRLFVPTGDGYLNRLDNRELFVARQQFFGRPGRVTRYAAEGVYALDAAGRLGLYDAETLRSLAHWDVPLDDVAPDGEGGFFATTAVGQLTHQRSGAAPPQAAALRRWGGRHSLAYDRAGGRLFAGNMLSGDVQIFDAATLRPLATIAVGRGVSELVWSAKHETLFAGRYFTGDLIAYAGGGLRELRRINLGRRLSSLALDNTEDYLLVVNAAGIFSLEPKIAFPNPEKPQFEPPPLPAE